MSQSSPAAAPDSGAAEADAGPGWRLLPADADVGWPAFAALGFLAFLGIRYLHVTPDVLEIAATASGLAVFLIAYFCAYWLDDSPLLLLPMTAMAAVGVVLSAWNMGAFVFFFYAAYLAGWMGRGLLSGIAVAVLLSLVVLCHYWFDHTQIYLLTGLIVTASISGSGFQARRLARTNQALRASREQVSRLAQAAERERIARDLHDALGRELTAVTLKADLAARLLDADLHRARRELADIADIGRSALDDVRRSVQGEAALDPLAEAHQCGVLLEAAGIDVDLRLPETLPDLARDKATALGFVFREAVTNVVRHADARRCTISLGIDSDPGSLQLCVADDGRGIGLAARGRGLCSMEARLADLGGGLDIVADSGTQLRAWIPL
jgi:two-component system sensor histidine kinase DesK